MAKQKKMSASKQKELLEEVDKLKAINAKNSERLGEIKEMFQEHFDTTKTESVYVGDRAIKKVVSSHSLAAEDEGVKVKDATDALVRELNKDGKENLLEIKANKTSIYLLANQGDKYCKELLKKHRLKGVVNYTIEW